MHNGTTIDVCTHEERWQEFTRGVRVEEMMRNDLWRAGGTKSDLDSGGAIFKVIPARCAVCQLKSTRVLYKANDVAFQRIWR